MRERGTDRASHNKREHGTMTGSAIIDARDVSLTFQTNDGPVHALRDVNLQVEKGDFVSFILQRLPCFTKVFDAIGCFTKLCLHLKV